MRKNKGKKGKTGDQGQSKKYKKKDKPSPVIQVSVQPATPVASEKTAVKPDATNRNGAQTQQQKRAAYALKKVNAILEEIKKELGDVSQEQLSKKSVEFKSQASSLPPMILMNGLGQTAAFYFSRGGIHKKLYDLLSEWLTMKDQPYEGKTDLKAGITEMGMTDYLIAQAEALLLLDWVKKFANAFVRK